MSDIGILHALQKGYVVIGVQFISSGPKDAEAPAGKVYYYKAEASLQWEAGNLAVVSTSTHKYPVVVYVKEVHEDPIGILDPNIPYSWAIDKVDTRMSDERMSAQRKIIHTLRTMNARRQAMQMVQEFKDRAAQLGASDELLQLETLSNPPIFN